MEKINHDKMKTAIGLVLKKHREEMKLNQTELAELVYNKPAQQTVTKNETARRKIPFHEILAHLKVFKINANQFFKEIQATYNYLQK